MKALPEGLESYRRTGVFTEDNVPAGLLKDHSTKEGAWAVITVLSGQLRYHVTDPRCPPLEAMITPQSAPAVIEPEILHHVETVGPVRFYIEFFR